MISICRRYSAVAFLEAHGSHLALRIFWQDACVPVFAYSSQARDDQGEPISETGGMCVLVSMPLFGKFCSVSTLIIL